MLSLLLVGEIHILCGACGIKKALAYVTLTKKKVKKLRLQADIRGFNICKSTLERIAPMV